MVGNGETFFMCFLAIWASSSEKVVFSSVVHFFVGSMIFGNFSFSGLSLYIEFVYEFVYSVYQPFSDV
jgi:hypothetical protein